MKYAIIEIFEKKNALETVHLNHTYICVDEEQQGFIYTDHKFTPMVKIFDTQDEAVEWGNQNLARTAKRMKSFFKVMDIEEKDIFVTRLAG